jgi:hypothetical protein
MMKLKDKSDTSMPKVRLLAFRHVKYIFAVEVHRPCRGTIEGPDNMEQGAFSGSGSPDNGDQLSTLNLKIDALNT